MADILPQRFDTSLQGRPAGRLSGYGFVRPCRPPEGDIQVLADGEVLEIGHGRTIHLLSAARTEQGQEDIWQSFVFVDVPDAPAGRIEGPVLWAEGPHDWTPQSAPGLKILGSFAALAQILSIVLSVEPSWLSFFLFLTLLLPVTVLGFVIARSPSSFTLHLPVADAFLAWDARREAA